MNIIRSIRRLTPNSFPMGPSLPDTKVRYQEAILETKKRGMTLKSPAIVEQEWPEIIKLQVRWQAVSVIQGNIIAQVLSNEANYSPASYYDPQFTDRPDEAAHACQAINLVYEGVGGSIKKGKQYYDFTGLEFNNFSLCLDNGVIYKKKFRTQKTTPLILRRYALGEGKWLITPPHHPHASEVNLVPILAYGGYAKPGSSPDSIEPLFARLCTYVHNTHIEIERKSELVHAGLDPPFGGLIQQGICPYIDAYEEGELLSLSQTLKAGYVTLKLKEAEHQVLYKCISYILLNSQKQQLLLTFTVT